MYIISYLLYIVVPTSAIQCSYPDLIPTCEGIARIQGSDWLKASQWKAVLLSLDLNNIRCDDEDILKPVKQFIKESSVFDESLFDFEFSGSLDENSRFTGKGINPYCFLLKDKNFSSGTFSFFPSTVSLGRKLVTPEFQSLNSTFVGGVAEGVSIIIHTHDSVEEVFLQHGVPVGLGVNRLNHTVVSYKEGQRVGPSWRFSAGMDIISYEVGGVAVVFMRVGGGERVVLVRGETAYELDRVQWSCKEGLLLPGYEEGGYKNKYELIKNFPPVIDKQDQIVYQITKIYIDIMDELKEKQESFKNVNESWILKQAKVRDDQYNKDRHTDLGHKVRRQMI